jgi:hypothetical protein
MKSLAVGFIFVTPVAASWHQPGSPIALIMPLGLSLPALPALRDIEIGQRCRIAEQDIISEFGSTGFDQLVEGIIQQVDVYQGGD